MASRLQKAVEVARTAWHMKHGKCSICNVGHRPEHDGYHYIGGRHRCGNNDACTLCKGCLPPGEQCQACGRINVWDTEG